VDFHVDAGRGGFRGGLVRKTISWQGLCRSQGTQVSGFHLSGRGCLPYLKGRFEYKKKKRRSAGGWRVPTNVGLQLR